jgi:hypothetical protein
LETQKTVESYEFEDLPAISPHDGRIAKVSFFSKDNEDPKTPLEDSHDENSHSLQDNCQATEAPRLESDAEAELNCECAVDVRLPHLITTFC